MCVCYDITRSSILCRIDCVSLQAFSRAFIVNRVHSGAKSHPPSRPAGATGE